MQKLARFFFLQACHDHSRLNAGYVPQFIKSKYLNQSGYDCWQDTIMSWRNNNRLSEQLGQLSIW